MPKVNQSKTRKQQNCPFYLFMMERIKYYESRNIRKRGGLKAWAEFCDPEWTNLAPQEKDYFYQMSKAAKESAKANYAQIGGPLPTVSNPPPAAEIIEEDKRQERIMEVILDDIMTGELEELINRKFVVIKTIHSYKDVLHGECYPAELAMASFNVLSGFKRYYWTLIDALNLPSGKGYRAKEMTNEYFLPLPGSSYTHPTHSDYAMILSTVKEFIDDHVTGYPKDKLMIFTMDEDIHGVEGCLKFLFKRVTWTEQEKATWGIFFQNLKVYKLSRLLVKFNRLAFKEYSCTKIIVTSQAVEILNKRTYNFNRDITCAHHRLKENSDKLDKCCCNVVLRRVYLFLWAVGPPLHIERTEGYLINHFSSIVQKTKSYIRCLRPMERSPPKELGNDALDKPVEIPKPPQLQQTYGKDCMDKRMDIQRSPRKAYGNDALDKPMEIPMPPRQSHGNDRLDKSMEIPIPPRQTHGKDRLDKSMEIPIPPKQTHGKDRLDKPIQIPIPPRQTHGKDRLDKSMEIPIPPRQTHGKDRLDKSMEIPIPPRQTHGKDRLDKPIEIPIPPRQCHGKDRLDKSMEIPIPPRQTHGKDRLDKSMEIPIPPRQTHGKDRLDKSMEIPMPPRQSHGKDRLDKRLEIPIPPRQTHGKDRLDRSMEMQKSSRKTYGNEALYKPMEIPMPPRQTYGKDRLDKLMEIPIPPRQTHGKDRLDKSMEIQRSSRKTYGNDDLYKPVEIPMPPRQSHGKDRLDKPLEIPKVSGKTYENATLDKCMKLPIPPKIRYENDPLEKRRKVPPPPPRIRYDSSDGKRIEPRTPSYQRY